MSADADGETRGTGSHTAPSRSCPYCEAPIDEQESLAIHLRYGCPARRQVVSRD